ncbi:MAG: hypothetical protein JW829_00265 [Pirellulales bacterium]|nr:hypothetical protein [Pirellulales bacterium]
MIIYYLSTDHPLGDRLLPPIVFKAVAFHQFDEAINGQLADLSSKWSGPATVPQRSYASAWRFRRFRRGRNILR